MSKYFAKMVYTSRDSWYDEHTATTKGKPKMPRYEITIDNDSISELSTDASPEIALLRFAADADVKITNVEIVPSHDTHLFFAADVTLQFDADADDAARYVAYYDADPEILTIV